MSQADPRSCILVVDDDGSVLVSLALLLKQSGFEVLSCDDPGQVPGLLASRRVDLVLQDMEVLPGNHSGITADPRYLPLFLRP